MAGKFELYKDAKGKFRFRLKAGERRNHRGRRGIRHEGQREERHRLGAEERPGRHGGRPDGVARSMPRRKQIYKITYPNGKIYVGMDLIGTLINVGSRSARERIAADLDAHRLDLTLRKRDSLGVRDGDRR